MTGLAARRDVRLGQTWTTAQRRKNDAIFALASLALAGVARIPRARLPALGRALGRLAHAVLPRSREAAARHLALAFPALDARAVADRVRRNFVALGEDLADTLALLDPEEAPDRTLALDAASAEALAAALATGRGVVYVTAHLGPWERMAALLASRGFPISTVARESYDPRFDALYDRLRGARGVDAIYRGRPGAPLAIVRALARGRVVGFLVDLPGRIPAVPVRWMAAETSLALGPARIALRTRAPIVVGTPAPAPGGTLRIRIEPLHAGDLGTDDAAAQALTQRFADALSGRVRDLPERWPWLHRGLLRPAKTAPESRPALPNAVPHR